MEFEQWKVWEIHALTVREKVLMGHQKKQKEMLCGTMM